MKVKFLIFLIVGTFSFSVFSGNLEECKKEAEKICSPSMTLKQCVEKFAWKFSDSCSEYMVKSTSGIDTEAVCMKEYKRICGNPDSEEDCVQNNKHHFTSHCRGFFDRIDNPIAQDFTQKCSDDIQKGCILDDALLDKNPGEAVKRYESCLTKNLEKSKGACENFTNKDMAQQNKKLQLIKD